MAGLANGTASFWRQCCCVLLTVFGSKSSDVMSEPSAKVQEEAVALVKSLVASSVREAIGDLADQLRDDLSHHLKDRLQSVVKSGEDHTSLPREVCLPLLIRIRVCSDFCQQPRVHPLLVPAGPHRSARAFP